MPLGPETWVLVYNIDMNLPFGTKHIYRFCQLILQI